MVSLLEISYLTEALMLSKNIDERKFKMALKIAQESLLATLGPEFYEQLVTQYSTNPVSFSADNLALYENYVKDFLAWQTYVEFISFSQLDSTPTGFRQHVDDNSTIADDIKFFSLSKNVRIQADNYKNKMINYLKLSQERDSTKFSLWRCGPADTFAFGISSVSGCDQGVINIHKAILGQQ